MGKGSQRRPENAAAIAANWPFKPTSAQVQRSVALGIEQARRNEGTMPDNLFVYLSNLLPLRPNADPIIEVLVKADHARTYCAEGE